MTADPSRERGAITLFVAIAAIGLLALAGLVVDGAAKVRAVQRADRIAAEAARAAGQAVDRTAVLRGEAIRVDRRAAAAAAGAALRAADVRGTVAVVDAGRAISVAVDISEPTVLLGLVGVPRFHVTGHAEAVLVDATLDSQGGAHP
ncbi:MAG: hypothetical protein MUF35_10845 [Candidatus Nanopelagicales bacterium]|nr:hypothetical protein [Candidatus Nanopelagicales bacterium]